MKIEIKGIVYWVNSVQVFEKFSVQEFILFKPGYTNEFGDKVGQDEYFPVKLFNDDIEKHAIVQKMGKKVSVSCFLNGKMQLDMGIEKCYLQLRLKELTVIN